MEVGDAPVRGDARAPVTVVMFGDFQCPFSARAQPTLEQLLEAYPKQVRVVWKNLPMAFHQNAMVAAEAAMAAGEQGKFWPMHDRLFANQKALDPPALERHAQALGLDMPRFRKALADQRFLPGLQEQARFAHEAGIDGIPTFYINGQPLPGAVPFEQFKKAVDDALARPAGAPTPPPSPVVVQQGSPRSDVPVMDWPPARLNLPDELLGERLRLPFPTGDAPSAGPARAPVEVVYVNDYNCDGCGVAKPLADGLRTAYHAHVRLVARPVPVCGDVGNGLLVAEAAWAAHAQGKFWPMHDKLFSEDVMRTRATLERYAAEIGLDLEDFRAALDGHRFRAKVLEDVEMLRQPGLMSRPLFIVNGRLADSRVALIQLVDTALKKAGIQPPPLGEAHDGWVVREDGTREKMIMGLSVGQRFHLEARDEAWAAAVESQLSPLIERDARALDRDARVAVACRSRMCRVRVHSPGADRAAAALLGQLYHATLLRGVMAGDPEGYLHLRDREPVAAAEAVAKVRSQRSGLLYSLRSGRTQSDPRLPVDKLPRD
jgi:protein-disulfide isomerase